MMQIFTERLVLCPISEECLDDVYEYGCDEETGRYMVHWPKSREQVRQFINECVLAMKPEQPKWYELAMQLKQTRKTIGNITLIIKKNIAEIGWISNKRFWNRGYMSEAVKEVIAFAFQNIPYIDRIEATCAEKNAASYRVMEKCGMTRVGREENVKYVKNGTEIVYTKLTYRIEKAALG